MDQNKVITRYAKAYFSLAKERKQPDIFKEDVEQIYDLWLKSKEFKLLLESPVIGTSRKMRSITSVLQGKIDNLTLNFLHLVTKNKREIQLPEILKNILAMFRGEKEVRTVMLTSAVSLRPETVIRVKKFLEEKLESGIELNEQVNPELIGGFVLRIDDKQVDTSVATHLRRIREKLLETEITQK